MNTKSFAFVLLRVLSIWILTKYVIPNLIHSVISIYMLNTNTYSNYDFLDLAFFMPVFLFIIWLITAWFLWFKAEGLSNRLVLSHIDENEIEQFDQEKLLYVSILILGIYFILNSIPILISNLLSTYTVYPMVNENKINKQIISIVQPGLTLIIGLFCVIKTVSIKNVFDRLRKLGS